ncbi:hypothetical protein GETHLI_10170 [Geothrix limicola]|uniref:Haemolysin activator HlyB C-terminal domain-containing protein n=2 Tax=Geothrix limicola TaxID=2927978 RepID=A0ABQ5QEE4_9BACT|nr:hypothetical protein GETHLI_10170 [Geothrix limicola]
MLQDGATTLRQARLDWTLGQTPLGPSSMPSFEVGWGGAGAEGPYAPLMNAEGLGHGTRGWGLGLQGRYVREGWSFSTTFLALRDQGRTTGILQRAALAYQTESGWRAALEQAPFAWGAGLNGGDLMGDSARAFPRISLSTPEAELPLGRWQAVAFAGRLERNPPIPEWISDRPSRLEAESQGLGLQHPVLWGGLLRAAFGALVQANVGVVSMRGGQDALGHAAPETNARTESLAELRVRIPPLARWLQARGASVYISRSAAPEDRSITLAPARDLGGLHLVWEGWDLGLEYAGGAAQTGPKTFLQPACLAGFSSRGDALGPAFGREVLTRTVELGLPLFLEGRGRFKAVRGTAAQDSPLGPAFWCLQAEAQWRTPTGRFGASLASLRQEFPLSSASGAPARWGWSFGVFQAFRVF